MEHEFTKVIKNVLRDNFGENPKLYIQFPLFYNTSMSKLYLLTEARKLEVLLVIYMQFMF